MTAGGAASRAQSPKASASTREAIVTSAVSIVIERGPLELTLDKAARAANVSKGGLLYHFPSLMSLIDEIVDRAIARIQRSAATMNALATADLSARSSTATFDSEMVAGLVLCLCGDATQRQRLAEGCYRDGGQGDKGARVGRFVAQQLMLWVSSRALNPGHCKLWTRGIP